MRLCDALKHILSQLTNCGPYRRKIGRSFFWEIVITILHRKIAELFDRVTHFGNDTSIQFQQCRQLRKRVRLRSLYAHREKPRLK